MLRGVRRQFPDNLPVVTRHMQLVRVVDSLLVNPVKLGEILRFNLLLERIKNFPGVIVKHGLVFRPRGSTFPIQAPETAQLVGRQRPVSAVRGVVQDPIPIADIPHQRAEARLQFRKLIQRQLAVLGVTDNG